MDLITLLTDPRDLDRPADPDGARDRARHRQRHLHLDPRPAPAGRPARPAPGTSASGLAMGMRILLLLTISWIVGLTAAGLHARRHRVLVARPDPHRRRPVPALEGHDRDPRVARGRGGPRTSTGGTAASMRRGPRPDRPARHRLLARLGAHRGRHGRRGRDDDRRRRHRGRGHARRVGAAGRFVHDHPSVKMLALSFLLLIGVTLIADGFGFHIDKAYIYAAMGFSVFVEALNLRRPPQAPAPRSSCARRS